MLIPSFKKMGTGKIPYSSFKVQLYFPNQGLAVILKKNFFSIPAKPLMGKYNCTFHDSQGIFISFTRRCAARKGNIPSPFFKMTGLGHFYYKITKTYQCKRHMENYVWEYLDALKHNVFCLALLCAMGDRNTTQSYLAWVSSIKNQSSQ